GKSIKCDNPEGVFKMDNLHTRCEKLTEKALFCFDYDSLRIAKKLRVTLVTTSAFLFETSGTQNPPNTLHPPDKLYPATGNKWIRHHGVTLN
ncbi:hypothetical protein CU098_002797, partial [Rhizopus stolonifer]